MDQHASLAGGTARKAPTPRGTKPGGPEAEAASAPPSEEGGAQARSGFLHIGPDWRITFAHLEDGAPGERQGAEIIGRSLWELYPELKGSVFEEHYRATMAD